MFTTERLILRPYKDSEMDEIYEFSHTYNIHLTIWPWFAVPPTPKVKENFQKIVSRTK